MRVYVINHTYAYNMTISGFGISQRKLDDFRVKVVATVRIAGFTIRCTGSHPKSTRHLDASFVDKNTTL